MHPQIQQKTPGFCPICGMALESEDIKDTTKTELHLMQVKLWAGVPLAIVLLVLSMYMHYPLLQFLIALPIVTVLGDFIFIRTYKSLPHLNMFSLLSLGISAAFIYSMFTMFYFGHVYFETAGVITVLVILGQVLELKARSKTNKSMQELIKLTPKYANVIHANGAETKEFISDIRINDILHVKPGEKVPLDGVITEGSSDIDQSFVTGESMPISKKQGDRVIGGTINHQGSFKMRVEKLHKDSLMAQIIALVSKAQRTKAPIQKYADQISGYFVPIVIIIAAFSAFCWHYFAHNSMQALISSVSVLIIACPCALGLATPMAIMVAMGKGARQGILIKNAEALELLERIDTLVVDKTGTLTEGKPQLVDVMSVGGLSENEILNYAASLERESEHSIAEAILQTRKKITFKPVHGFKSIPGEGIQGLINNHEVIIGKPSFLKKRNIDMTAVEEKIFDYQKQGHTVIILTIDDTVEGTLTVADNLKKNTHEAIAKLKEGNLKIVMLTGDNENAAAAIAESLGITYKAEVLPESKYEHIKLLQKKGHKVAMAGDGVNDAPALAQADVGIAMSTGIDVALESADITLLNGDLMGIVRARKLSKDTMRNIRQNLFLAFIYNILMIPIAAGLFYPLLGIQLSPMFASFAMVLSSVSVILNALRFRKNGNLA